MGANWHGPKKKKCQDQVVTQEVVDGKPEDKMESKRVKDQKDLKIER